MWTSATAGRSKDPPNETLVRPVSVEIDNELRTLISHPKARESIPQLAQSPWNLSSASGSLSASEDPPSSSSASSNSARLHPLYFDWNQDSEEPFNLSRNGFKNRWAYLLNSNDSGTPKSTRITVNRIQTRRESSATINLTSGFRRAL